MTRTETLHENLDLYFTENPLSGSVLVVDDFPPFLTENAEVTYWHTRYKARHDATPLPDGDKKYDAILIRLPKSHEYFDYILQVTAPLLVKDASVYVYGMNDEGIKGAQKKLTEFFQKIEAAQIKNHARIIASSSPPAKGEMSEGQRGFSIPTLKDFSQTHTITHANKDYNLIYYPGMFGTGKLDDGTALLLDATLTSLHGITDILDYACGSGIIARVLLEKSSTFNIDLIDNDILSLEAARQNVAKAHEIILGDSLVQAPKGQKYDLIISNPPIHTEKQQQFDTLNALIANAPQHLNPKGQLIIVTQARIKLEDLFEKHFTSYGIAAETTKFKVWRAHL